MTPTSRTLDRLRADGWDVVEVVERWIPRANIRRDFIGIGDVLGMTADRIILVQCTSDANVSARIHKAQAEPRLRVWLSHPSRTFEVWGWGQRQGRWECRRVPVVLDELAKVSQHAVRPIMPQRRKAKRRERGLFDQLKARL
jgi:hypothetical protein